MPRMPFLLLAFFALAVCVTVIALPESLIVSWLQSRRLTDSQAGWAYGLLVLAAAGQAVYSGFVTFGRKRVDELRKQVEMDKLTRSLPWNAAITTGLTFVYGIAALRITGQRGGFWIFPVIAIAQGAWLLRDVRLGLEALEQRNEPEDPDADRWSEPDDFTPAIARGVSASDAS